MRRRIAVWNEAREQENPQNLKFVSALIKQANKIDLAFPELFTQRRVIAVRIKVVAAIE